MIRRILDNYQSSYLKALFVSHTNERTPWAEHILPIFKVFGTWTGLSTFLLEEDGNYTEENTLKLMECSYQCLKTEMGNAPNVSQNTYAKHPVFTMQCVDGKTPYYLHKAFINWKIVHGGNALSNCSKRLGPPSFVDTHNQSFIQITEQVVAKLDREQSDRDLVNVEDTIQSKTEMS
ncbi:hypothetical protein BDA99DRAFT_531692 [Phascolomyces articulosus]|uniref:Uncharacterized protein n=1 Tax=Phascolomyces articulosus TaxID=60185 RepID=A0AAD5KCV6_9FUNG|nr:hypothetical protein BDA99DRAFT_531692 [Phascolomyces articulosus]